MSLDIRKILGKHSTRVIRNTFFLTSSEIAIKIVGFLWVIFLARQLSLEHYGRYTLVNAFVALFAILPDLGVGLIAIREIAKDKKRSTLILSNTFFINAMLGIATFTGLLILSKILNYPKDIQVLVIIAGLSLLLSSLRSSVVIYFEAHEKMLYTAILNAFNTIVMITGGLIAFLVFDSSVSIFQGMLIGITISFFVSWFVLSKHVILRLHIDKNIVKKLLLAGLPLGLAALSYMIYTRIDSIILHKLLGEQAVGQYNAATPFVFALIQLLNVPFAVAIYPALSEAYREDRKRFVRGIKKSLLYVASWSFPLAFIISFLAPVIMPLVFGMKYASATPILQALIYFVPFASLSALLYKMLIITNRQNLYFFISLVGVGLNLILNLIFIPRYLVIGAAYASVATQFILVIIYGIVVVKTLRVYKKI